VCSHGACGRHTFWDYATCWEHLKGGERGSVRERLSDALRHGKSLANVVLTGADLRNFDFTKADLRDAFLDHCDLRECRFVEANLQDAYLGWSDLQGADLSRAELNGCVLTFAKLANVTLLAYSISFGRTPINLYSHLFGPNRFFKRSHINEAEPGLAQATYRALKRYFIGQADYDSASWASYSEKLMHRKSLWDRDKLGWLFSLSWGGVCGYGEKPARVIASGACVAVVFGALFRLLHCATQNGAPLNWPQSLYFSFATLSDFSFSDVLPSPSTPVRFLITTEVFLGILLLGLFIFTLTKRFVGR
jgi:uncharacterized protein YjbI with pentapeptide repeats